MQSPEYVPDPTSVWCDDMPWGQNQTSDENSGSDEPDTNPTKVTSSPVAEFHTDQDWS